MAKKLFAVTYVVDLVVLAKDSEEACKIAYSNLQDASSLIGIYDTDRIYPIRDVEPPYHAHEPWSGLPDGWEENCIPYSNDNDEDRTIKEILEEQKKNAQ